MMTTISIDAMMMEMCTHECMKDGQKWYVIFDAYRFTSWRLSFLSFKRKLFDSLKDKYSHTYTRSHIHI